MVLIVDDTELSWCHTVNLVFRMNDEAVITDWLQGRWQITGRMTDLERDRGKW